MNKRPSLWPVILIIIAVYLLAALVEPCDGHSCDAEVTHGTR
jgi:hypothetical protein